MAIALLDDSECIFPGRMHFWCDRSGAVFVCVVVWVYVVCVCVCALPLLWLLLNVSYIDCTNALYYIALQMMI